MKTHNTLSFRGVCKNILFCCAAIVAVEASVCFTIGFHQFLFSLVGL